MLLNIEEFTANIKERNGINLDAYACEFLVEKIERRMSALKIKTGQSYLRHLCSEPTESDTLLEEIGINVSQFFRNPAMFNVLEERILPDIITARRRSGRQEIRIWSAGCASGEEPYSAAMLVHRLLRPEIADWQIFILATDINRRVLGEMPKGLFPRSRLVETRLGLLDDYFVLEGTQFQLKPEICRMVNCSFDDLASTQTTAPADSIFGAFDLVLCRNVMIYFNADAKVRAMRKLSGAITPGGYLILGETGRLVGPEASSFTAVDDRNRIYRKNKGINP